MPAVSKQSFIKRFNGIARHHHRYTVFSDFVTMAGISLHNAINKQDHLEQEYLSLVKKYSKDDAQELAHLLGDLVMLMDEAPKDVLGQLYMELELGNDNAGQFFTPPDISYMMAQMTYGDELKELEKPFITLCEPAAGAGGMVLSFARVMMSHGLNPAQRLWAHCTDVDRVAAWMCYTQLSLWHIPAIVVVGNSLTLEVREHYYTPTHYMGAWDLRLRYQEVATEAPVADDVTIVEEEPEQQKVDEPAFSPVLTDSNQFDFGF